MTNLYELEWENIHSHSHYSNIMTPDSVIKTEDLAKRAVAMGQKTISTVEHGYFGSIFDYYETAQEYGLKLIFGIEYYFVKDRFEKDRTNSHLLVVAKNEEGRREMTSIMSEANKTGFFYHPRIDEELLFSLTPENVIVTTACLSSPLNSYSEEEAMRFLSKAKEHFGDNFYIEVQPHTNIKQVEFQRKILKYNREFNFPLMLGVDSHYIKLEDDKTRDLFLKGKNIHYPAEDGFTMDYPDITDIVKRLKLQGVLTDAQIEEAITNTLVARDFEGVSLDKEIKMPSLYPDKSHNEKVKILKELINKKWEQDREEIPKERWGEYIDAIREEIEIIEETKMEDYFLLNHAIVKKAVEEYAGVITSTGRGSGASFYVNKLLGLTDIDRVNAPITLYPTRFMSKSRIIETRSLPDIDLNLADPEPFRKASKDILGEDNSEWMVAYGTMKEAGAFKNYARSIGIDYNEANQVSDDLDRYKNDMRWGEIIEASSAFRGVIDSVAPHPCFVGDTLVNTDKGLVEIEKIKVGDMVLTHKNRYKKVTNIMKRESKDLYELKAMGSPYTVVTGSHPYYTRRKSNIGREFSDPTWKSVEELKKGDYLGFAINQKNVIPSNENLPLDNNDFWWIIGRYLGDGWWKNRRPSHNGEYLTIICANKKNSEVEDIKYKLNNLSEYFNYYITEEETVYRVNIQSKFLYEFIKDFGKGAKNKRITGEVMNLPPSLLRSIIDGYISADGSLERDRRVISFTTVSPELAHGMSSIIMKAYKRPVKMYKGIVKDSIIDGRIIKGGIRFVGKFTPIKTKGEQAFYEDGYIWAPFRKKKRVGEKNDVFNLEVESDNSYTANSMIVHNCSHLLLPTSNTSETTGTIKVKDEFVTLITSSESDNYKYLKNDLLSVTVVDIIQRVYDMIGKPRHTIRELEKLVEGDDNVWKLYRDGIVATLNQTGTKSGKPQVMQYKPTSVAELSMWVASIRPGFASLKQEFFNRKEHKYGIDSLDAVLSETNGYMIFQENIMAVLMYAGISEDRTYSIIKGISKKVPSIVDNAKEEFYTGFLKRTTEEGYDKEFAKNTADEVWKVMEDASDYSFNASHAYSVALDSVYGAYLKAYYPLEYYTVILNIYQNDSDKIAEIEQELDYFGIKIGPIVFGGSRANYTPDKETNTIFKGIWSVKFMNERMSEELFELSQTEPYLNKEKDALDLFLDLIENTSVNSRQTEILINLDFFAEFGKPEFLLNLWNTMNNKGMPELVDERYADKKKNPVFYNKNHIEKTKAKRIENLREYIELLKENPPAERTTYEKIMYEREFIGHATTTFPELPPSYVLITDLNLKYTPILEVYQLSTGKTFNVKIKKNKFYDTYDNPIVFRGNIIRIIDSHREHGKKLVDGKWHDNKSVTWMFIDKMSIITG